MTSEADSMRHMKERAKEKGFNFPYLYDGSPADRHATRRHLDAGVLRVQQSRKLVYTGAMDDNMKADKVTKHYVEDAVEAALKGDKPATETTPASRLRHPVGDSPASRTSRITKSSIRAVGSSDRCGRPLVSFGIDCHDSSLYARRIITVRIASPFGRAARRK